MGTDLNEVQNPWKSNLKVNEDLSKCSFTTEKQQSWKQSTILSTIKELCLNLTKNQGVHSVNYVKTCGFRYTGKMNTARCDDCGLELDCSASNIDLFRVHSTEKPNCPFILKLTASKSLTYSSPTTMPSNSLYSCPSPKATSVRSNSISSEQEIPSKRLKIETNNQSCFSNNLFETNSVQEVRKRTFSHWSQRVIPSQSQMIEAGFYNCNVGDRVICIYCNLICQQWTAQDDPCEVHKTLSPNCIYVKTKLIQPETRSMLIVNEALANAAPGAQSSLSNSHDPFRCNELVTTDACHRAYAEIPKRSESFSSWNNPNMPSVEDLVRAGFFYTGTKSIVTCFYCNGSLQNWGANDNPMIEHARWFPYCAYAKQLCGAELHRKIQESKRAQQERARATESRQKANPTRSSGAGTVSNSRQLLIPDESTLSRLVAARLDLPISQRLLDKNFKLSVIKRCWEDQLRTKQDDFVSDSDLHMACLILQKQIEHIDGKKENIIIPNIKMKQIQEEAERAEILSRQQPAVPSNSSDNTQLPTSTPSINEDVEMSSSQTNQITNSEPAKLTQPTKDNINETDQGNDSVPANACLLCQKDEKRLACIPCGHLATCVSCGPYLRSCPICRREIEAFVKVYV